MSKAIEDRLSDLLLELIYLREMVKSLNTDAALKMLNTLTLELTKLKKEFKNGKSN